MRPLHIFNVSPLIPEKISRLKELAYNLWWSWDIETIFLFRRMDPDLWEQVNHNPVKFLGKIRQSVLEDFAQNEGYIVHYNKVCQKFDNYMEKTTWYHRLNQQEGACIAYFSAEFGLTECLPIYSGGLGVLAGDHLKAASDLGIPIVAIGLLYQQGYFRQYLNTDGWQQEEYLENDFYTMPLQRVCENGKPLLVEIELPGRQVKADIWKVTVGRVRLYLLNTNLEANHEEDRNITSQLYGGGPEMRICQEILLGIGGVRALRKLGYRPNVYHMNEGHSAFLGLEQIRLLMAEHHLEFEEAWETARSSNIFTTHTPVPAGVERFGVELMEQYFGHYYPTLNLDHRSFLGLGRENPKNEEEPFCMAILALRLSNYCNGISALHGKISRQMWQSLWPDLPQEQVPIDHITNAIHTLSWTSHNMVNLLDRYLGLEWKENAAKKDIWDKIDTMPDEDLWRTHEQRRTHLVKYVRKCFYKQLQKRSASLQELKNAEKILKPGTLTIGFARRFATYKRATLILSDPKRLAKILNNPQCPVQIIFAGKAHPRDEAGKKLISHIVHLARQEEFRQKLVFLEDYDMNMARYLVQGVDIWLNNPRRPQEASGTSGMKASVNGALNLSVLDGWWDEGYNVDFGWAIGAREEYKDATLQDNIEHNALYELLEMEIVPLFYERDSAHLPRNWIKKMKAAMKALCPFFNTARMLQEYTHKFYIPAGRNYNQLSANGCEIGKQLNSYRDRLEESWHHIRAVKIEMTAQSVRGARAINLEELESELSSEQKQKGQLHVGEEVKVQAILHLGHIPPREVTVEVYYGPVNSQQQIMHAKANKMELIESLGDGNHHFTATIPSKESGRYGFAVRILPFHENLATAYQPGLIKWL